MHYFAIFLRIRFSSTSTSCSRGVRNGAYVTHSSSLSGSSRARALLSEVKERIFGMFTKLISQPRLQTTTLKQKQPTKQEEEHSHFDRKCVIVNLKRKTLILMNSFLRYSARNEQKNDKQRSCATMATVKTKLQCQIVGNDPT